MCYESGLNFGFSALPRSVGFTINNYNICINITHTQIQLPQIVGFLTLQKTYNCKQSQCYQQTLTSDELGSFHYTIIHLKVHKMSFIPNLPIRDNLRIRDSGLCTKVSRFLCSCLKLLCFDSRYFQPFSTLYTSIPHESLKTALNSLGLQCLP